MSEDRESQKMPSETTHSPIRKQRNFYTHREPAGGLYIYSIKITLQLGLFRFCQLTVIRVMNFCWLSCVCVFFLLLPPPACLSICLPPFHLYCKCEPKKNSSSAFYVERLLWVVCGHRFIDAFITIVLEFAQLCVNYLRMKIAVSCEWLFLSFIVDCSTLTKHMHQSWIYRFCYFSIVIFVIHLNSRLPLSLSAQKCIPIQE